MKKIIIVFIAIITFISSGFSDTCANQMVKQVKIEEDGTIKMYSQNWWDQQVQSTWRILGKTNDHNASYRLSLAMAALNSTDKKITFVVPSNQSCTYDNAKVLSITIHKD